MGERFIEVSLDKRGVTATARLLDDRAPRTCAAVWGALPLGGDVYHAKYARNEIYALLPGFAEQEPGPENLTVTPIPGDLVYFSFSDRQIGNPAYGYGDAGHVGHATVVDLALFYDRNNLLINGDQGWVPGSVYGTIVDGLDTLAEACNDLWRTGASGETLSYRRA